MTPLILLGLLLALKHFLADGLWQTEWHYTNKGTFLHLGGIAHSANHGFGTLLALIIMLAFYPTHITWGMVIGLSLFDFVTHYITDYGKMNLTKGKGYSAMGTDKDGRTCQMIYDNTFYVWLVADQCVHFSVYALIMAYIAGAF